MKRLSMIMVCLLAMMAVSLSAKAQDVTITLYPGWNWISYPKAEVLDVNTALGDFVPMNGDKLQSQFSNSSFSNGQWRGGVTHFIPGWGYKYYSNRTEVVSFVFGEAAPQLTVTTAEPTAITANSAVSGGSITSNDGSYVFVLEKGICWATHSNPTVMNDFHTENGEGPGGFTAEMIDLSPGMVYYVRAYVVTANGTTYGPEKNFTTKNGIPIVYTDSITDVFSNRATCGGLVTDDGGLEVIAKGVCWSTFSNPTINECHTTDGTGLGSFISVIMGLNNNTTYYVRAYATNSIATYYGNEEVFMTPSQEWEGGVLPGVFSISEDQYVHFSQGNLQYQASTNTWRFAENQWEFVGGAEDIGNVFENGMKCSNNDISSFYSGWIDLFGWGTSGYDHGAVCYQPWSISQIGSDYWAYGTSNADLNDQTGQADWGYNAIINGGGIENQWHSLTIEEWNYILYTRSTLSGIRFVKAIVNNVNGLILLPDEWSSSIFPLNNINQPDASFGNNIISVSLWSILNMNGAVFLPTAGKRISTLFSGGGNAGYYWSATGGGSNHAPWMQVSTSGVHALSNIANFRYEGYAVRLVCPVE